ncbi:MAG: ferrous iron transport protein A [Firmicutes bacterium]|nr:ferrous iron transport protein A [Bacillota bacterium]
MTLDQVPRGTRVKITDIADVERRLEATRLGLGPGAWVRVTRIVPKGPIIVHTDAGQIAIGRQLARNITVSFISLEQ